MVGQLLEPMIVSLPRFLSWEESGRAWRLRQGREQRKSLVWYPVAQLENSLQEDSFNT